MRVPPQLGILDPEAIVQEVEKSTILAAMAQCNQHRERTVQFLGISVRTLRHKKNRYSVQ